MDYNNEKLNIYLKTKLNHDKTSKNISYELSNIKDELKLKAILKDLKIQITDIWKQKNIINLSMPLTIRVKFKYNKLMDLDRLKDTFYRIGIIDNYTLEEFNINNSFFEIYYYGNPMRLSEELLRFGYELKNIEGHWALYSY